jgi:hypothetical protein
MGIWSTNSEKAENTGLNLPSVSLHLLIPLVCAKKLYFIQVSSEGTGKRKVFEYFVCA